MGRRLDALTSLLPVLIRGGGYLWRDYLNNFRFWIDLVGAIALLVLAPEVLPSLIEMPFRGLERDLQGLIAILWVGIFLGVMVVGLFLRAVWFLQKLTAYEGLRTQEPPKADVGIRLLLQAPLIGLAIFTVGAGLSLWLLGQAFEFGSDWELNTCLSRSRWLLIGIIPPLAEFFRQIELEPPAVWPGWIDSAVSFAFFGLVLWMIRSWVSFRIQRIDVVRGLSKPRRHRTPYGFRLGASGDGNLLEEPHEQVLLMQAERIGVASVPYLAVEIRFFSPNRRDFSQRDPLGLLAAAERVSLQSRSALWRAYPEETYALLIWIVTHVQNLVLSVKSDPSYRDDHRIAQAITTGGSLLGAAFQAYAKRLPDFLRDLEKSYRASLREVFLNGRSRPTIFRACCEAVERLDTPEAISLLEEQVRFLDLQAGYSIDQTNTILEIHDRLLGRAERRLERRKALLEKIKRLGLEPENDPITAATPIFRRLADGARMAWIEAGSFIRGDSMYEDARPMRRVHLCDYLIDVEPVSAEAFRKFIATKDEVICTERGFFPVQNIKLAAATGPAQYVTWFAAEYYAREIIPGGHLPTEAQWEKAARGPLHPYRFPTGNDWHDPPISPYGVHICHLLEWCRDAYDPKAYGQKVIFDPFLQPESEAADVPRVVRGRNPADSLDGFALTVRIGADPLEAGLFLPVGFRVAVEVPSGP